jgi:outer membrane protein TolC
MIHKPKRQTSATHAPCTSEAAGHGSGWRQLWQTALLCMAAAWLGGCASLPQDTGFAAVQQAAKNMTGKDLVLADGPEAQDAIARRVSALLAQPLSADAAVQLALLNHRGLQATLQDLGIGQAQAVQATRLPNPGFSFGRNRSGDEREIERGLHLNLARLFALPMIARIESRRLQQVQGAVTLAVLNTAADTRKAYIQAVAAEETVRYMQQVMQAAQASAELARRMAAVGNFNKLQRAREQGFYAEAALNLARAQNQQRATRERLTRLLGLWGAQIQFTLPERLPDLPRQPPDQPDIESVALAQRIDVAGARAAAEQAARNLELVRSTRFISVLEGGVSSSSSNEGHRQRGWEVDIELPLFDGGGARIALAQATVQQAEHRAAQIAIDARSEVREAYGNYRAAWDIARHHFEEVVPLRKLIAEENVLRYNGMLIGVFELLADARVQIASVNAAIEALRDFWLAQADLDMAMVGKPSLAAMAGAALDPAADAGPGH